MPLNQGALHPMLRVLVIEDSEPDRLWLRARLRLENLEVVEAADGLSGLEKGFANPPDLILLDLGLPTCDGFEVLQRLKLDERTRSIPVIVVSGATSTSDKVRGLDLGAVDFVTKPYNPVELRARIRAALRTKMQQDHLANEARRDGLTRLANRTALEERLAHEWSARQRHNAPLAVWMVDLDHFKVVNDMYGHLAGDEVLIRIAAILRRSVRVTDMVARYGGEEFVVIAPYCGRSGAVTRAEDFLQTIARQPIDFDGHLIQVTASIGIASAPDDPANSASELLGRADEALYQAKQAGRNRVMTRPDPTTPAPEEAAKEPTATPLFSPGAKESSSAPVFEPGGMIWTSAASSGTRFTPSGRIIPRQ
jgi:two-component system cell cycle response regulator